jgi:hypothetical protein
MKLKNLLTVLLLTAITIVSCSKGKHEEFGRDLAKAFKSKKYKDFDTAAYNAVFKEQFVKLRKDLHDEKWINQIYTDEDKGLTLLGAFLVSGKLDTLSLFLSNSKFHGLKTSYFHADSISKILNIVKTKKFKKVEDSYPYLAKLELYSADGLINYANILKYGAVNPKTVLSTYYVSVKRPAILDAKKALDQLNLAQFLNEIQPKNGYYQRLMNILINDGKDGANPLTEEEKQKVYLSMERLRWPVEEYKGKYLLVNIPEFQLRLIEDNKTNLQMKVCVGEAGGHETPILSGMVNHMQVNPVWNIPQSIANKEILTSLVKDASYLESHDMVAYKGGQLVESHDINWSAAQPDEYSFKQNPGADNSLGQIKFLFHNPYAIYLHDTPAQAKFKEDMRAVSHGCIRVEKPMKLAQFLLDNENETERIIKETDAAARGEEAVARWVNIKNPVPVFISYYTAFTDDEGNLITSKDVYGYDKLLLNKFEKYMAN